MKIHYQSGKKVRIEMLPLIDIVFLLLVFFIYAMLSMAVHRGLPLSLPKSSTTKIEKHLTISISIDSNGSVFLDKVPVPLEKLKEALQKKATLQKETGVLLFAEKQLTYQRLFRVLDEIKKSGLTRVSLQAEVDHSS